MISEIKKLSGSQVEIFIEIPGEDFDKHYEESFKEIASNVEIPGFRPGKAPEKILKDNIKEESVLKKAAERAIRFSYFPLLNEKNIEAIGQPEILITKMARGNSFCYKVKTAVLPEIILPDYKKIAKDVKEKLEKDNFNLYAGKQDIGENDNEKHIGELKKHQKLQMDILGAVANASKMEIPDILVESEVGKMVAELKSSIENMDLSWNDYLSHLKKTENELMKEWGKDALRRVKYGLILKELADKENIEVPNEEIESEISAILKQNPGLDKEYLKGYTYGMLRNEKVLNFLEEI